MTKASPAQKLESRSVTLPAALFDLVERYRRLHDFADTAETVRWLVRVGLSAGSRNVANSADGKREVGPSRRSTICFTHMMLNEIIGVATRHDLTLSRAVQSLIHAGLRLPIVYVCGRDDEGYRFKLQGFRVSRSTDTAQWIPQAETSS